MDVRSCHACSMRRHAGRACFAKKDGHKQSVLHRDLKPKNIFLTAGDRVRIGDLGCSKLMKSRLTRTQVGTPYYMAPELWQRKHYDGKCDVWSLGCILYQMAYGHTPFSHIKGQIQKLFAITNEKHVVDFPPASNPQLLEVMKSCLRRNPAERPSIPELLQHPLLRGGGRAARP